MADFIFDKIDSDKSKRYIYGTYIEMAFHNFFITLQHIYKRVKGVYYTPTQDDFGKEFEPNSKFIFDDFVNAEDVQMCEKLLTKHFPFLKVIEDDFHETDKRKIIKQNWFFLKSLRNAAEHDIKTTKDIFANNKPDIIKWLRTDFVSGRDVKKRGIAIAAKKEMKDRFFLLQEPKPVSNFMNNCTSKSGDFTFRSFIVYISLFLEGKYTYLFITNQDIKSRFDYTETNRRTKVATTKHFVSADFVNLYRALSIYNINLPAVKYDAQSDEKHILGLDIVNELQKCPKELYEHLSPEDQNIFRPKSDGNDDGFNDNLLQRFQDRFASLVLRYIDTKEVFKDIRFQVSLGKYRYKFYDKQCIDSDIADRVRILQKELKSYGRLSVMEQKRKTEWTDGLDGTERIRRVTDLDNQAEADTAQSKPYITDQIARYNLDKKNHKIPLWWDGDCDLPIAKDDVSKGDKHNVKSVVPKAFLSVYDLPAVMFLHFLGGDPEKLIKDNYDNYRKLFGDIKDGNLTPDNFSAATFSDDYGINFCDVPQKLQEYLEGTNASLLQEEIATRLEDKQKDILADLKYRKEKAEKENAKLKSGRLADFLAKNIVMLVNDNKKKPTSKNYDVLQQNLALYESFDRIKCMFERSEFADCHPFVNEVLAKSPKDATAFYRLYLKEAIKFFENIDNCKYLKFYKYQEEKFAPKNADYYKKLAEHYLSNGYVELTNRIFDTAIREKVCGNIDVDVYEKDSDGYFKYNIAFLINRYYQEYQPFYDYKRQYKYLEPKGKIGIKDCYYESPNEINAILQKDNRISYESSIAPKISEAINSETKKTVLEKLTKIQEQFSNADNIKRYRRETKNNETDISRYRLQDKILFEMAKALLVKKDDETRLKMRGISEMRLSNVMPNDNVFDRCMEDFQITITFGVGVELSVIVDGLKMKNYSTVYRTIFDRRLETLAKSIRVDCNAALKEFKEKNVVLHLHKKDIKFIDLKNENITLTKLKEEFGKYDENALKNNKLIFDATETQREIPLVKAIRNCFAHWSYPHKDSLKNKDNKVIKDEHLTNLHKKMLVADLGDKCTILEDELEGALGV